MDENKILEILNLRNSLLLEYKSAKEEYAKMDDVDIMESIYDGMLILKAKVIAINQVLDILGYEEYSSDDLDSKAIFLISLILLSIFEVLFILI